MTTPPGPIGNSTSQVANPTIVPQQNYKDGDIAWTAVSTALVFIMIPGLAFFYGGMARTKNALSLILVVVLCMAVVSIQVRRGDAQVPVSHRSSFSVVDLGLQPGVQSWRFKFHWRPGPCIFHQRMGSTGSITQCPDVALRHLPVHVRSHHARLGSGISSRTWSYPSDDHFHFYLEYSGL